MNLYRVVQVMSHQLNGCFDRYQVILSVQIQMQHHTLEFNIKM